MEKVRLSYTDSWAGHGVLYQPKPSMSVALLPIDVHLIRICNPRETSDLQQLSCTWATDEFT